MYFMVFDEDKNEVIDLDAWTCTCRQFQLEQLPCAHVMIDLRHIRGDVYNYCSDYYSSDHWKFTYVGIVYPPPHQVEWVVLNEVHDIKV